MKYDVDLEKKFSLYCMMKKCNNNVYERLYVYVGK